MSARVPSAYSPVKKRLTPRPTYFIPSHIDSPNPLALSCRRSITGLDSLPALGPLVDLLGAFGDRLADPLGRLLDALADLLGPLDDLVRGLGRLGGGGRDGGQEGRGQHEAKRRMSHWDGGACRGMVCLPRIGWMHLLA